MTWKPLHEAHAVERVRVLFHFADPLPSKMLRSAFKDIVDAAPELGFDMVAPAGSSVSTIVVDPSRPGSASRQSEENGVILRRHVDNVWLEEVGFRDSRFGYVSNVYGRWKNLRERISEVLVPALEKAEPAIDLASIRLEYWDSFNFDGDVSTADASGLLAEPIDGIPTNALQGASTWHSHIGWFEEVNGDPLLINRNIDMVSRLNEKDEQIKTLGIYTLVERRGANGGISIRNVTDILEHLHNRSLTLFGETLSQPYREKIGIDLEAYR